MDVYAELFDREAPRLNYDLLVTAVSERADLFDQTLNSLLAHLDQQPARLVVHEDVRPGSAPGEIGRWLQAAKAAGHIQEYVHKVTSPARGLGPAMLWCFRQAKTPIVFYSQEDWQTVRQIPVAMCLEIMERHGLNHVRFNKRKTMRAKHADTPHPWFKKQVTFADAAGEARTFCVSDHFYTQASLWRVAPVLDGLSACAEKSPQANAFVAAFNHFMNMRHIGNPAKVQDQDARHAHLKTYIWGPVGEPAFIQHLGSVRTTGPIVHVGEIREMKRRK